MCDPLTRNEYLRRIHAVQDYIESNLDRAPRLAELADIAGFSQYHFHRIFHAVTGETLLQYHNRVKLERATAYLLHSPKATVTDIAYHYGFADSAVFSRAFKARYGVSPSACRQQYRKNCNAVPGRSPYDGNTETIKNGSDWMSTQANGVELQTLNWRVIYVRFTGTYPEMAKAMPGMMQKIYRFALGQKLLNPKITKILSVYHDNPELTEAAQLRTSLCMVVPEDAEIRLKDDIGEMRIEGVYAVGHFELMPHEYPAAWQYLYGEWLPGSGYQPRDTFPFEVYVSDPSKNPGGKQLLDVYVPVEPLGTI